MWAGSPFSNSIVNNTVAKELYQKGEFRMKPQKRPSIELGPVSVSFFNRFLGYFSRKSRATKPDSDVESIVGNYSLELQVESECLRVSGGWAPFLDKPCACVALKLISWAVH